MSKLTQARLKEALNYDPATGVFTWLSRSSPSSNRKIGAVAGSLNKKGNIIIGIDNKLYPAHHLAWLYMTGELPTGRISHIDTVLSNNRLSNLRKTASPSYKLLTQARLKQLLHYDPITGIFTRLTQASNYIHIGDAAGCVDNNGYNVITCDWKRYKAHRLAFLYMTGQFPKHHTDHIDGTRTNNVFSNLREATRTQNNQNRHTLPSNNTSGFMGVHWHKVNKKWAAKLGFNGEVLFLGLYTTQEEASAVYLKEKRRRHLFNTL